MAASVSSRRKRSNLKLLLRYNSLSSQLRLRHKRRVKILVFTRDLKINYGAHARKKSWLKSFFHKKRDRIAIEGIQMNLPAWLHVNIPIDVEIQDFQLGNGTLTQWCLFCCALRFFSIFVLGMLLLRTNFFFILSRKIHKKKKTNRTSVRRLSTVKNVNKNELTA